MCGDCSLTSYEDSDLWNVMLSLWESGSW